MGFIEGRNVAIDYQYAENQNDRLMALTADLLRQPVAVIYAGDNITAVMVKSATTTIPVVFRIGGDPIQLGLVTSLSRPDGNMTGVSFLGTATGAIRLQMMREAVPNAAVMGLLVNPANPNAELDTQEAQNAARKLGLELHVVGLHTPGTRRLLPRSREESPRFQGGHREYRGFGLERRQLRVVYGGWDDAKVVLGAPSTGSCLSPVILGCDETR